VSTHPARRFKDDSGSLFHDNADETFVVESSGSHSCAANAQEWATRPPLAMSRCRRRNQIHMRVFFHLLVIMSMTAPPWFPVAAEVISPAGAESLPALMSQSAMVLTGDVVSVEEVPITPVGSTKDYAPSRVFVAAVAINRIYKGQSDVRSIRIVYENPRGKSCFVSDCEKISPGEYYLFFLEKIGTEYRLLNPQYGKFPLSRLHAATQVMGLAGIEADLVAGLNENDPKRLVTTVELFGSLGHVSSTEPLRAALAHGGGKSSPITQGAIYVSLFRLGDYSRLSESGAFIETTTHDPQVSLLQQQLCAQIAAIRELQTSPTLITFSRSSTDQLRESAVHALREMSATDAIPTFVAALDDPLQPVRYDAVLALATLEKNWDLAPSLQLFSENEIKYITAWKNWWLKQAR